MKHLSAGCCFLMCVVASSTGCSREQQKSIAVPPAVVSTTTTILATIPDQEPQREAGSPSSPQAGAAKSIFSELGRGVAYVAERNGSFQVVHNGKAGKLYQQIDGNFVLSRDGAHVAYRALTNGKWRVVVDGREGRMFDTIGTPRFSPDGKHILYDALIGDRWYLVVDEKMNDGCRSYSDKIFSGDSAKIVYMESPVDNGPHRLVISNLEFKKLDEKQLYTATFVYNRDKSGIAAVADSNGKKRLIRFSFNQPDDVKEGPLYDGISNLAFAMDGVTVAYVAEKGGKRYLVMNGKEEKLPEGEIMEPPAVRPDQKGAAVIIRSKNGYFMHQAFYKDGTAAKRYEEAAFLSYNSSGNAYVYVARNGKRMFMVVNGKEGPAFDKVLTPVFSPGGKLIACRVRKDGKRFVVVMDTNGKVVSQHPSYEMVFDFKFTADGKSLAYGVKEGQKLIWKVENLQ